MDKVWGFKPDLKESWDINNTPTFHFLEKFVDFNHLVQALNRYDQKILNDPRTILMNSAKNKDLDIDSIRFRFEISLWFRPSRTEIILSFIGRYYEGLSRRC